MYQKEFVRLVESSTSNGPAGEDASYLQGPSLEGMVSHHASEPDHISNTSHSFLPTGMPNSCCNVIHVPIPTSRSGNLNPILLVVASIVLRPNTAGPYSECRALSPLIECHIRRETWGEGTESGEASGGVGHGEGVEGMG